MKKKETTVPVKAAQYAKVAERTASERIVKISEGVYLMKPRNPNSKALPGGPYKGECRETKQRFVYFACNVKVDENWVAPKIDLHPDLLLERMVAREKAIAALPQEVLTAWNS